MVEDQWEMRVVSDFKKMLHYVYLYVFIVWKFKHLKMNPFFMSVKTTPKVDKLLYNTLGAF